MLISNNASFAIVSGGHSSNLGASNIHAGITIDLSFLRDVKLVDNASAVVLGPASRWDDVYAALEPHGLTVAGARVADVGVGGFALGGGVSWFANQMGFSCDTVLEFQVVTPDLRVLNVSEKNHENLFWALKGSLGAFGVVTRLKMRTIANSGIYAGAISFKEEHLPEALAALGEMAFGVEQDEFTSGYLSFGYVGAMKDFGYTTYLVNTAGESDTASRRSWHKVPQIHSSMRNTTLRDSAKEVAASNPLGLRRSKFTFTAVLDQEVMLSQYSLFREFASGLELSHNDLLGATYQPLTRSMLRHAGSKTHPNVFSESLATALTPMLLVMVELWWEDESRDQEFETLMRELKKAMLGAEGVDGADHPWLYPNYAASWQEPLVEGRLGHDTVMKLQNLKKKYDSGDIWSRLVPGIWHV